MTLLPIVLPKGFTPTVKIGDTLTKSSVIAEKKGTLGEEKIDLTSQFKISPKDLNKSLKKNLGDFVEKGEVIAVKKGSFGISENKILSPFSGTIVKIDSEAGIVTIKTALQGEEKGEQIFSPVEGKVEICNNEKIAIRTSLDAILAEDALGEEAEGKIFYLENNFESLLNSEIQDKVLLIKTIDKSLVFKAIGLDVLGIVTQDLEDLDFVDLQEKKILIPIMQVTEANFEKLTKHRGANVYLNGKDKSLIFYE